MQLRTATQDAIQAQTDLNAGCRCRKRVAHIQFDVGHRQRGVVIVEVDDQVRSPAISRARPTGVLTRLAQVETRELLAGALVWLSTRHRGLPAEIADRLVAGTLSVLTRPSL